MPELRFEVLDLSVHGRVCDGCEEPLDLEEQIARCPVCHQTLCHGCVVIHDCVTEQ